MEIGEKLLSEIENKRTNFKADSYSMSIGELANLYKNGEIIIRPEYQRLFRWTQGQRVKLIESILLGIPIPSIFVYQDSNGMWELVDGLQRVSTILQFLGELEDIDESKHTGEKKYIPYLRLNKTKYLPSLEGYVWNKNNVDEIELPAAIKLSFKRSKLNFTIILSESDKRAKFEVFQRLNTGGSNASNQEIRNNVMIMLNEPVYKWFYDMSENKEFQNSISLSDRLYNEQYHMELLLRYISLLYYPYNNKVDLGDFFNDVNESLLTNENINLVEIKDNFERVFGVLDDILGDKSFKKYDGSDFKGKFLETAFESIAVGLGSNISSYTFPDDKKILLDKIRHLYAQDTYTQNAGSGSNAKTRIPRLIPFVKEYFKK